MVMDKPMTKVLIYGGKTGWIGGLMYDMCKEKGTCRLTLAYVLPVFAIVTFDALLSTRSVALKDVSSDIVRCVFVCPTTYLCFAITQALKSTNQSAASKTEAKWKRNWIKSNLRTR